MILRPEGCGHICGNIHNAAALVIENDTVSPGGTAAGHVQCQGNIPGQSAVVSINACRSKAS